jgi:spore cortex formation protein SpoVR/YcgB (stage V sporulation)
MSKLLYETNDWTFELLRKTEDAIEEIAFEELHLNIYPNQIEIIGSDQMLDAYTSNGLPMMYNHWSFGKRFIQQAYNYRKGYQGLAYELVINSNPCISYLMEENSMSMQTLVLAHAAYGHNHFFKNNYLFRQWTDASAILDYLSFAKKYIAKCEEQHGEKLVEEILDACHAITDYGVNKYKHPVHISKKKEEEQQKERAEYVQQQANELWSTLPKIKDANTTDKDQHRFPKDPQENLMYFIEKYSPALEGWQREIVRIIRKISQYFYPQRQTKLMNEGWACFVHYYIMNRLWEKGLISECNYFEFIHNHTNVLNQLPYNSKYFNGFNPYALGFAMFTDIRRICSEPTKEDEEYFPHITGTDWLETCLDAVRNYRDESFISQFLSPTLIRKWRLFEITNNEKDHFITISNIQDAAGYNNIRKTLSRQYSTGLQPDIQIINANLRGSRELELHYISYDESQLTQSKELVLNQIKYLWGYEVSITEIKP